MVLDIAGGKLPGKGQVVPLVIKRANSSRSLSQTWRFTEVCVCVLQCGMCVCVAVWCVCVCVWQCGVSVFSSVVCVCMAVWCVCVCSSVVCVIVCLLT